MSKSCQYYSENIDVYHVSMDNLVIAKKLFDLGKSLPGNYVFTLERVSDRHDSFFLFALEILFGAEAEILEDYGDDFTFSIDIDFVERWNKVEELHPEATDDREWICEPITDELACEYTGTEVEMALTDSGFSFHVYGIGSFYGVFEKINDCYARLQEKVAEWEKKEEDSHDRINTKRDNHSNTRNREGQHKIGPRPAAV
jgi:hypothetical protein